MQLENLAHIAVVELNNKLAHAVLGSAFTPVIPIIWEFKKFQIKALKLIDSIMWSSFVELL
jgi:hypothetical protein